MSTIDPEKFAHSADVQIHLSVDGHILSIGHLGPDYVILDNPIDHPPADAEISMLVDGKESRWGVKLIDGLSATHAHTRIFVSG
jgi:hypothetical protein